MADDAESVATAPSVEEAEQIARTFAIAVRNVSVYPTEHPRSQSAAAACLELVRRRGGIVLTVYDQRLDCNGQRLTTEAHLAWLVERFRNATLRGAVVSPHCTGEDLLLFARYLVSARRGGTDPELPPWPPDHPRLRALPLVFTGTFGGTNPIGPQTTASGNDGSPTTDPLLATGGVLGSASDGSMPAPREAIENSVLDLISEVVDESARQALTDALADRVIESLSEDSGTEADATGDTSALDKLRLSASIAQRYFGRPGATAKVDDEKPTGRPEDSGIQADLDQLLAEIAALPEPADPASDPAQMATCSPGGIAHQLVGVYLYLYVAQPAEESRLRLANPLRRALAALPDNTSPILDVYLGGGDFRALSENRDRLALLELIGQAGKHELIRERGYLDARLVAAGFPDCMPLAARVLGTTPEGLDVLRQAVDLLGKQHGTRTFLEMMREQALQDTEVVRAFIAMGGDCATAVLSAVAWGGRLELYSVLVEHLEKLDLPQAERKALAVLRPRDPGAASYLQQLYKEASTSVTKDLRRRSGEFLRRHVQQVRAESDTAALVAAIEDLALVPDEKTRELLRELGSWRNWLRVFDGQGAARAKARKVLEAIAGRRS